MSLHPGDHPSLPVLALQVVLVCPYWGIAETPGMLSEGLVIDLVAERVRVLDDEHRRSLCCLREKGG